MKENKHYSYIDILRIAGIVTVIMIHTEMGGLYTCVDTASGVYCLFTFISMCLSFAPAVFFMLSGALLLERDETYKQTFKRMFRIMVCLFVMSLLYFILDIRSGYESISAGRFLKKLISEPAIVSYWYLYSYLVFLLCSPFLRAMVKGMKEKDFVLFYILCILLRNIIPSLQRNLPDFEMNAYFRWDWMLESIVCYPVLGYGLHKMHKEGRLKKYLPFIIAVGMTVLLGSAYNAVVHARAAEGIYDNGSRRGWCSIANACMVYALAAVFSGRTEKAAKERAGKVPVKRTSLLGTFADCTFGIYLIHCIFYDRIRVLTEFRLGLSRGFSGAALLIPASAVVIGIYGLSFICIFILRRIPFIRRFL